MVLAALAGWIAYPEEVVSNKFDSEVIVAVLCPPVDLKLVIANWAYPMLCTSGSSMLPKSIALGLLSFGSLVVRATFESAGAVVTVL